MRRELLLKLTAILLVILGYDVSAYAASTQYSVAGGGSFCSGGTGVAVTLAGSDVGVSYQLYRDNVATGAAVPGTGAPISFGTQTVAGTYTAIGDPSTANITYMTGSVTVVVNPLPTAYTVTGGGGYCVGGSGSAVGLSFGSSGVQYTLMNGASAVATVGGANTTLSFGNMTTASTYTATATITSTGCTRAMSGSAVVTANTPPIAFNMSGGGSYCSGGTGVAVGLANSTAGISYQLYNGATAVGTPSVSVGGALTFGNQTTTGIYSVVATNTTTTCTTNMTGTSTVIQNSTPTVFTVSSGGSYCSGGSGITITLNGSTAGVNYQLYIGSLTTGSPVAGTGSSLTFGTYTASGTYSVQATNATTSCVAGMSGTAVITINTPPTAYNVGTTGSICTGATGLSITLSNSQANVNYQLYRSGTPVGSPIPGNGLGLDFGQQTEAGIYTVLATSTLTGCTSTMTGSATITVNALPIIYPVTGGGNYCSGSTGVAIGLGGSQTGVNYTLYNGATLVGSLVAGTNSPISFGVQTTSGTYTIFAINPTTGCSNNMSGTASIGINPLPTVYPVTGTGSYCAGGTGLPVGLSGSTTGVNYSLSMGASLVSVMSGTGSALNFGNMTTAGTYTVQATNSVTGCQSNMNGSAVITSNVLPTQFPMSSSGTSYCAGGTGITIGLTGTTTAGVDYQLYNGATASGLPVSGGGTVSFGLRTAAGTYTVLATNTTTGCTRAMTGTASITINPLPTVYAVTGGGSYCAGGTGQTISLAGSESGVNYQLYNGLPTVGSPVGGSGSAISLGTQTASGTYTVLATNATTTCTRAMSGSAAIVINAVPNPQTISAGGSYCAGGTGVVIGLGGSQTGINYQLYNGLTAMGSAVPGTNLAISFGSQTMSGTYTAKATNTTTGCTSDMTGTSTVSINAVPTIYNVTGGGSYCAGATGVTIGLSGTTAGVSYQLYNGSLAVGTAQSGTGAALNFGTFTTVATYYVKANNGTCTSDMNGSATVVQNALPTVQTVTGGGQYCAGGTGVHVGIGNSQAGISYQLYKDGVPTGGLTAGTGLAVDFGSQTAAGDYTVIGYNSGTGCTNAMSGTVGVTVNALPAAHTVTGGGSYCAGSTGVTVGLGGSTAGVSYQLYNGSAVAGTAGFGTGSAITIGTFTVAGTYSAQATDLTTGCMSDMSGTVTISINALPQIHTVSGGGTICQNSTGAAITLNNSSTGINYQLYNGSATVGAPVPGTGSPLSLGMQTASGTYTVMAINATTMCTRAMNGTATIVVNPLPGAQTLSGGGAYCAEGPGLTLSLGSSNTNVTYQLYMGSTTIGGPVTGTGLGVSFGLQTAAGTYSVLATSTITGCTRAMSNTTTISIDPLPQQYTVGGGGAYCSGGAGVNITLSTSTSGISYQLYNGPDPVGSAIAGDGTPLDFGAQMDAGLYKVMAINNITSCSRYMSGSATVIVNDLPLEYTVGGGGEYCAGGSGVDVNLQNSTIGVSYQLYRGGVLMGAPVAGNGGDISFGNQTVAGTYSVLATNNVTGCTMAMTGSTAVLINALPESHLVSGGGSLCFNASGVNVMLETSENGMEYQLYNGSTAMGAAIESVGDPIDFGAQTEAGTYKVLATNPTTGCTKWMDGSATVIVNALPIAKTVNGGGSYCATGTGIAVGLAGSQSGVSYQLYNGSTATGATVAGSGSAITFGMQTAAGTYSVRATNDVTGCVNDMTGTVNVMINVLPIQQPVLSIGSSYCAGGEGVNILLNSSETGISYQLYTGSTMMGTAMPGTGNVIDLGAQTVPGSYYVIGTNTVTGCTNLMNGSPAIVINPLPTAFTLTGGGPYCEGLTGSVINQSGSQSGVTYQLYNTTGPVGGTVAGNGGPITFGAQPAGSYVVIGTNNTSECTNQMSGSITSIFRAAPTGYDVTGGGAYCAGGAGVEVGISNTQVGLTYQLYKGGVLMATITGNGGDMSYGMQMVQGTYSILATNPTTGCTKAMNNSVPVVRNAVPMAYDVNGGGTYCSGTGGVAVGLANSALATDNISYQLYKGSTPVVGATMMGTGTSISFGNQLASGAYAVIGTNTVTGCTSNMNGSVTVTEYALPEAFAVTGGGMYCTGPTATGLPIGVLHSAPGISYELYKDGVPTGMIQTGTGSAISFGDQMDAGVYTVMGKNTTTLCTQMMSGSKTIIVNTTVVPAIEMSSAIGTTVCIGSLVTFNSSSVNGGTSPAYQWKVNGVNTGLGLTSHSYVPADGDVVSVTMMSSAVCASPAEVTATVTMNVTAHLMPQVIVSAFPNDTVCQGTTVTYTASEIAGGTAPFFVWKKNGVTVGAGPVYSYVPANGDVITCEMTSNFPCRLQDVVSMDTKMKVVVPQAPEVTITANPGLTISEGQNVKLTAHITNGGSDPLYKWSVNGTVVSGATNAMFQSSELLDGDEVSCEVTSGGYCAGLVGSETVTMKVNALGVGTTATASDVRLLPNPNNGAFVVRGTIATDAKEVNAEVVDVLGQVVYRGAIRVQNGSIDEHIQLNNNLANGMYILNLRTATETKTFHFVMNQ